MGVLLGYVGISIKNYLPRTRSLLGCQLSVCSLSIHRDAGLGTSTILPGANLHQVEKCDLATNLPGANLHQVERVGICQMSQPQTPTTK
jgi:hypothetical protein